MIILNVILTNPKKKLGLNYVFQFIPHFHGVASRAWMQPRDVSWNKALMLTSSVTVVSHLHATLVPNGRIGLRFRGEVLVSDLPGLY